MLFVIEYFIKSIKVIGNHTLEKNASPYVVVTMSVSRTVSEIFSVKVASRHLEIWAWGRSGSLKMVPFDRPCTTFYQSAIVTIALTCTIFELF